MRGAPRDPAPRDDRPRRVPSPAATTAPIARSPAPVDCSHRAGNRCGMATTPRKRRARPAYITSDISATETRVEILKLLNERADLGISEVSWDHEGGHNTSLRFCIHGRPYRIPVRVPAGMKDPDTEFRRLHRALAHLLKNIIVVADGGLCPFGEILAAFLATTDPNQTVGRVILSLDAGKPVVLALAPAESSLVPTRRP